MSEQAFSLAANQRLDKYGSRPAFLRGTAQLEAGGADDTCWPGQRSAHFVKGARRFDHDRKIERVHVREVINDLRWRHEETGLACGFELKALVQGILSRETGCACQPNPGIIEPAADPERRVIQRHDDRRFNDLTKPQDILNGSGGIGLRSAGTIE